MSAIVFAAREYDIVIAADKRLGLAVNWNGAEVDPLDFVDGCPKLVRLRDDMILGFGSGGTGDAHAIMRERAFLEYLSGESMDGAAEMLRDRVTPDDGKGWLHCYLIGFDAGKPVAIHVGGPQHTINRNDIRHQFSSVGMEEWTDRLYGLALKLGQIVTDEETGKPQRTYQPEVHPHIFIRPEHMSLAGVADAVLFTLRAGAKYLSLCHDEKQEAPALARIGQSADLIVMSNMMGQSRFNVFHIGETLGLDFGMHELVSELTKQDQG
ncbi:MAG TPA: hypothetical protein VFG50_00655 [Rhodothermales bacterium]|nr:hypothetical protein [Rhodothermales bacterium]